MHDDIVLSLIHESVTESAGFVPETTTYCVSARGVVYPIEIMAVTEQSEYQMPGKGTGEVITQWVSKVHGFSNEYDTTGWSAQQVIGEPDIEKCGDIRGSWTTNTQGKHYIEVGYEQTVYPTKLIVRENNAVGFVTALSFQDLEGNEHTLVVEDELTECPGNSIFILEEEIEFPINRVKIHIDANHSNSYEEIDAIALEGFVAQ